MDDLALKRWKLPTLTYFWRWLLERKTQPSGFVQELTYSQADLFQNGFVCFLQMLEESISLGFRFASAIVYSVAQGSFLQEIVGLEHAACNCWTKTGFALPGTFPVVFCTSSETKSQVKLNREQKCFGAQCGVWLGVVWLVGCWAQTWGPSAPCHVKLEPRRANPVVFIRSCSIWEQVVLRVSLKHHPDPTDPLGLQCRTMLSSSIQMMFIVL